MQVIRCEGLTKRYGDTVAVDRLDLTIGGGQVFGFLGPNGSGKTTTMRMLLGLITPTAGRAWVNDRPLPDPDGLARIGAMIEEPAFHPWLTGRRALDVLALHGPPPRRRDAVAAALDRVGLSSVADRKVKGYSQGMRQRLGLAAALLRDPALLVLDEPTNGMDPAGIREFRALLRALADDGTTVFLSSHLLAEVEQVCDRVAVMNRGRLVEEGPVAELATVRRRVRVVLDEGDRDRAREVLAGRRARVDGPGTLLVEEADGREVNEALGRAGVWAREILVERPGLEEAFLTLTATEEDDRAIPAR
ncbi:ABC transporter ATP-binding protein [Actinoallomurus soli]|uniref:ABC transporter ATP-binding protein n=1 Tax=Actinoallomurus soli TaxID=2952535 RepID=UPI002092C290|nr:ABC transporter ATP-binding protein [Actinoallomurus soli]MCO5970931.1 ABC transporter ATP-binding protein [Actinoallomurus soli]